MIPAVKDIYTDPKFREGFPPETKEDTTESGWIRRIVQDTPGPGFVFAEIGAGYGRWSVYSAATANEIRPDLTPHIIAVEPEPDHYKWLLEHLANNGVESHTTFCRVVAESQGLRLFQQGNPSKWYGQGVVPFLYAIEALIKRKATVRVKRAVTLEDVFAGVPIIDMVDMDIQGFELGVLRCTPDDVLHRIRWLYIGTHSREIEAGLRDLLGGKGWVCKEDIQIDPTHGFTDGIQVWRNPVL